jgi:hypothetical protein
MKKALGFWSSVALSYAVSFGTPIVAAYYIFAIKITSEVRTTTGGAMFLFLVSLVGVFAFFRFRKIFAKIPMTNSKMLISTGMSMIVLFFISEGVQGIQVNAQALIDWLYITIAGFGGALPFKLLALRLDTQKFRDWGLF